MQFYFKFFRNYYYIRKKYSVMNVAANLFNLIKNNTTLINTLKST